MNRSINDLIKTLKAQKTNLVLTNLEYQVLSPEDPLGREILNKIASFDNENTCFGDYDFVNGCNSYLNLGIYLNKQLIGYLGFCYPKPQNSRQVMITVVLSPEYRNCQIGDIILKQSIQTIFEDYNAKSIYVTILTDNEASQRLFTRNGFKQFRGYQSNDYFKRHGETRRMNQYLYTNREYQKHIKTLKPYGKIRPTNEL